MKTMAKNIKSGRVVSQGRKTASKEKGRGGIMIKIKKKAVGKRRGGIKSKIKIMIKKKTGILGTRGAMLRAPGENGGPAIAGVELAAGAAGDLKFFYPREVARRLLVTEQHVLDLIEDGRLQATNVGRRNRKFWRIPHGAYERFIREN